MELRSIVLALVALACASPGMATAAVPPFEDLVRTGGSTMVFGRIDDDALLDGAEVNPVTPAEVAYVMQGPGGVFGERRSAGAFDVQDPDTVMLAIADPADSFPVRFPVVRRNDVVAALVGAANAVRIFVQGPGGFQALSPVVVPGLGAAAQDSSGNFQRRLTGSDAGDVTGDGRADAVFTVTDYAGDVGRWDRVVVVTVAARGFPTILVSPELTFGATRSGPSLFDVTGDGVLDVVSGGSGMGFVTATGGQVSGWSAFPINLGGIGDLAIGRFNGDASPDFVVIQGPDFETSNFYLLLSRPDGAYEYGPLATPSGIPCAVGTGHLDRDGRPDLVLRGCGSVSGPEPAMTLLGDGRGGFSKLMDFGVPGGRRGAGIIDLNGDGFGDLVFTGGGDSSTVVYMNRGIFDPCPGCGTTPGGGDGGTATIQSNSRAPALGVALRARRWNPRRPLRFRVGCDERCQLTVSATLSFTAGARRRALQSIPLKTQVLSLSADTSARVSLELRPASIRLVRRLLGRGLAGRLAVRIRATGSAGNASQWAGAVPLRRPPR